MSVFENFTKKVTETAKAAARKSSDLVEVTKLNMSIGAEEDKTEKVYAEIGKLVYESYTKGETIAEVYVEKCKQVESIEETIKEMKMKILDLKNAKVCPGCKEELDLNIKFCPKCGAKQEIPEPLVEEPDEKICPNCNMSSELNASFCSQCGTKLETKEDENVEE